MSVNRKNKVQLIVYGDSQSPHYFHLNRRLLRFIVTALPTLAFLCLGVVTVGVIYFKNIRLMAEKKEPKIIEELRQEKVDLETKLTDSAALTKSLEAKLIQGSSAKQLSSLSLFKQTVGSKDLSNNPALTLDEIELVTLKDKILLQFNIVNNSPDNVKLAGYVLVSMKLGNALFFYPENVFPEEDMQIVYSSGESFATYRFRPVNANFPVPLVKNGNGLFRIFVFSRTGDLIHKQTVSKEIRL